MDNQQNRSPRQNVRSSSERQSRSQKSSSQTSKGTGRGWHGDSEGHARAGSQSHKNRRS